MQRTFIFEENDYAFIRDHCPEDSPVIPFVSALNALYVVLQERVGPCALQDVRLVKGIILPKLTTFETRIEIDEDKKTVQLIGLDDVVHYKATYNECIENDHPIYSSPPKENSKALKGDYDFLFHGPLLHSIVFIQTNETYSEATGILKTASGMKWPKKDWFLDPFACDGALQMGCQLAFMTKQKASLPSKITRAIFYQKPSDLEVYAHLIFRKISGLHYVFDAYLFDKNHKPVCSLEGVESYFRLFKNTQ